MSFVCVGIGRAPAFGHFARAQADWQRADLCPSMHIQQLAKLLEVPIGIACGNERARFRAAVRGAPCILRRGSLLRTEAQSATSSRRARTAGTTITTRISTVAMMKARLSGLVTNTDGSPPDISIERRRFSSIMGPST
jgi:hypothetical protein